MSGQYLHGDDWVLEGLATDEAREGQCVLPIAHKVLALLARHCRQLTVALGLLFLLPLLVDLPACFVVTTVVQELATVAVAAVARLFVVLAQIWLVVHAHCCSNMR